MYLIFKDLYERCHYSAQSISSLKYTVPSRQAHKLQHKCSHTDPIILLLFTVTLEIQPSALQEGTALCHKQKNPEFNPELNQLILFSCRILEFWGSQSLPAQHCRAPADTGTGNGKAQCKGFSLPKAQ